MAKSTVELEILANVQQATRAIEELTRTTQKQLDGINTKTFVSALSDGFNLIQKVAGGSLGKVVGFIEDAIAASEESARANTKLAQSMRVVGDFSEEAVREFSAFADELSRVNAISDETIKEGAALAKTFNLTNKEAQGVVKAAIDLSAATGQDLNSSITTLAQSYNGFIDKSLKKMIPELKSLTQEQLAAGAAVAIVGQRFQDSGRILADSYTGNVTKAKLAYGELLEALGDFVTKNDTVNSALKSSSDLFASVTEKAKAANGSFAKFFGSLFDGAALADAFGDSSQVLSEQIKDIGIAAKKAAEETGVLNNTLRRAQGLQVGDGGKGAEKNLAAQRLALKAAEENEKKLKDLKIKNAQDIETIRASLSQKALSKQEQIELAAIRNIASVEKARSLGNISLKERNVLLRNIELVRVKEIGDEEKRIADDINKKLKERSDLQKKILDEAVRGNASDPGGAIGRGTATGDFGGTSEGVGTGLGLIAASLKGAEGAANAIASGIGAAAQAITGLPIGPIVSEIVGTLAKGPEEVKKMIDGFVDAIPEIVKNIALAIPAIIVSLSKKLPELIRALIDAIPEIVSAFIAQVPEIVTALVTQAPRIAIALVTGIIQNIPKIVEGFAREFLKIPERFVDAILDLIPGGSILSGGDGGGVGGFISGAVEAVGNFVESLNPFAEGGRVPDLPKFEGDRFPARLNAGEQVLSKDLSSQLESFLNSGGEQRGSQQLNIVLQVGEKQLADVILDLNRNGFRLA